MILFRAQINVYNRKTIEKNNETKSWFSEEINKFNKYLGRLIRKKRGNTQITNITNGKGILIQVLKISRE